MTTSQRELALAAVFARLQTISGAALIARLPAFRVSDELLPAVVMIDGGDEVTRIESNQLQISTGFGVVIGVKAPEDNAIGPALNAVAGKVGAALGADPTLGNLVSAVLYQGSDPPARGREDSTSYAAMALHWSIERWEREFDPYAASP